MILSAFGIGLYMITLASTLLDSGLVTGRLGPLRDQLETILVRDYGADAPAV